MDKKRIYYIYKIIFLCGSLKDHYYIGKGVQYYQNIQQLKKIYKRMGFVNEWNSIMGASRFYTGGDRTNISCICNGKRHFALGYRWSYEKYNKEKIEELKKNL